MSEPTGEAQECKRCTKCGQVKPLDGFARRDQGRRAQCKDCRNAWRRDYHRRGNPRYRDPEKRRQALRAGHRRAQVQTADQARNHYKGWTGPELDVVTREDITIRQAALLLGRTHSAVNSMRYRLRVDPRKVALLDVGEKWVV